MVLPIKRFRSVLTNVKNTIAGLASFQTLTGAADATAAKAFIHDFAADDTGTQDPPRIILDIDGYTGTLHGGRFNGPCQVLAMLQFEIPAANAATEADQAGWFWDQVEDWFDELEADSNGGGQLSLENIEMSLPPGLIEPDENSGRIVWLTQFRLAVQT